MAPKLAGFDNKHVFQKAILNTIFREVLFNGKALGKFQDMIQFQGVDRKVAQTLCFGDPWSVLRKSEFVTTLASVESGFIHHIDAFIIGKVCVDLGAGRTGKSCEIDTSVGIRLLKVVGDEITENQEWITVYHKKPKLAESLIHLLSSALHVDKTYKLASSKITRIVQ